MLFLLGAVWISHQRVIRSEQEIFREADAATVPARAVPADGLVLQNSNIRN